MAAPIPHFVAFELPWISPLFRGLLANLRRRSVVAVVRVEGVVYMAFEVISSVKPRANANEDAAIEPFGP